MLDLIFTLFKWFFQIWKFLPTKLKDDVIEAFVEGLLPIIQAYYSQQQQ